MGESPLKSPRVRRRRLESYWTVAELAEAWGMAPETIRRRIADGNLAAVRFGRLVRVADSEVRRFASGLRLAKKG